MMDAKAASIATIITGSLILAVAGYVLYCYYPYGDDTVRELEEPTEEKKDKEEIEEVKAKEEIKSR